MPNLQYVIAPSWLGQTLVAWSQEGVCAVLLGDKGRSGQDALHVELAALAQRWGLTAQAVEGGGHAPAHPWAVTVLRAVERMAHEAVEVDVPWVWHGTAFQRNVWQKLRQIPRGMTWSYGELAAQMGCPQSVRAVASACGANVLALVVPCHRVVRRDGSVSGYRWGVSRKQQLLQAEAP